MIVLLRRAVSQKLTDVSEVFINSIIATFQKTYFELILFPAVYVKVHEIKRQSKQSIKPELILSWQQCLSYKI